MPRTNLAINDDAGGMLDHPGLNSGEILDLVNLSAAAYAENFTQLAGYDTEGWTPVTADLIDFGLDEGNLVNGLFFQSNSFPNGVTLPGLLADALFPGTAEATLFENEDGDLALAFRGTAGGIPLLTGDAGDWDPIGQQLHFAAFSDLFDALNAYLADREGGRLLVTGHSLGGAMVEFYMDANPDGTVAGVTYEAVAVASPQASFSSDTRVLNIGHESDIVYSIVGTRTPNAISELNVVFDENFWDLLPDVADVGQQHNIAEVYTYTAEILLASQFYSSTERDTLTIISLTNEAEEIREVATNFFSDDPSLILGIDEAMTFVLDPTTSSDDFTLSPDDFLIGGNDDDSIEGFGGDDTIQGDVGSTLFTGGNDTMAGGAGADMFLGTPGDLNGDVITDLEIGDRIGVSGATVDEETLDHGATSIFFNADSGILDIGGTNVAIAGVVPEGATIVLLDETLEDGGSILEVVPEGGQDIAFVIDTTGSMSDDIAEVQASVNSILDALFAVPGSRAAIVTFNDFGFPASLDANNADVLLPFTTDEDAVRDAINGISVFGGGDFPEFTFEGLYLALSGAAGEWREGADDRKIVLFGDAIAKDPELAAAVFALANDLGASIDVEFAAADDMFATKLTLRTPDGHDVEIYTVTTGSPPASVIEEFRDIAEATGGATFDAEDPEDLVATIIEIIEIEPEPDFDDTIEGGTGTDELIGSGLAELIKGKGSDDLLVGLDGDDALRAGKGNDSAFGGAGDDFITGGHGRDLLNGGAGDDTMIGGRGNDRIEMGEGVDEAEGGLGADTFFFTSSTDSGRNVITDLTEEDMIDLSEFGLSWLGRDKFSGEGGEVRFRQDKDRIMIDLDGDQKTDFYIQLEDGFSAADIEALLIL